MAVISDMDNRCSSGANACAHARLCDGLCLLVTEPTQALPGLAVIYNNRTDRSASAGDVSFKFLAYQLPTVGYRPTVAMTGNGEKGDSIPEREPEKRLPHLRKAAGAQITQSRHWEVVPINNNTGHCCLVIGMSRL